jgi:Anti-sigma factor NepR
MNEPLLARRIGGEVTKLNPTEDDGRHNEAALDPKALEALGRALKAHYDDLVHAPLPDKFVELLGLLEAEEQRRSSQPGGTDAAG